METASNWAVFHASVGVADGETDRCYHRFDQGTIHQCLEFPNFSSVLRYGTIRSIQGTCDAE
jgi:hypothetical protein